MAKRVTPLFAVALGLGGIGGVARAEQAPTTPRTLPSGAPACGNAQSKSPQPCTTTTVALAPRTLPTGAPACGNVLDKVSGNQRDPIYVSCIRGEAPGVEVRNRMVVTKVLRLLGISSLSVNVPAARPRELRSGAPAPGNVARRTARPVEPVIEQPAEPHHD